jgi:hypothetical protein
MTPSLERELRELVLDYLNGIASLDQLKVRVIDVTRDADRSDEPAAIRLAYEIFMALADQSSDLTTEREMREALSDLVFATRRPS